MTVAPAILVLDASMALAWIFQRQKRAEKVCADRALGLLGSVTALVPHLWHAEVANGLLVGERRKVVAEAQADDYLDQLYALPIASDDAVPQTRRSRVVSLARLCSLSVYDATYLELALRSSAVLATFDSKLAAAMRLSGGTVLE